MTNMIDKRWKEQQLFVGNRTTYMERLNLVSGGIQMRKSGMIKRIHVNQHNIKRNRKHGTRDPVITVKTYKSNTYAHNVHIDGPCDIIYSPDKPLPCGAQVWIETIADVQLQKE